MGGEFQWFGELPFEIDGQADWDLVPRVYILGRHFELVLAESVETTESDTRVGDNGLSCS